MRKDDKMATKSLNTRIVLKCDTTANWATSTLVLLKGEQAIEITESGACKIKIGDGVKTFKDLPYATMTPAEISSLISSGAVQSVKLESGTNNGTVALTVDGTKTDNIAVKGLGSAAYTNSNAYAAAGHGHTIANVTGLQEALNGKAASGHTHDDRYYTESEINTKLNGKANSSHSHAAGDITSVNASAIVGTIGIDHLPAGALERCVVVANDDARFALTTAKVQQGDTVKVTATGKMYFVVDDTKLSTEAGYEVYTAGSATSVPWSGVTGKPSTFTPSAHKHTIADVNDLQATLNGKATAAQGAKADSAVQSVKIGTTEYKSGTNVVLPAYPTTLPASDVKAWAKADTKPSYTKSEVGLGNVDNTADANKSVKYATSAGSAGSASTLGTSRNFSITGGATAAAVGFNGSGNVALNVTSVSTDVLNNGANTLVFNCGDATA